MLIGCIPKYSENKKRYLFSSALLNQIIALGGIPLIILDLSNFQYCDGFILAGGDDINPTRYHQDCLKQTVIEDANIEDLEFKLVNYCLKKHIPLLGICRGMQVIHVAVGGCLNQHIAHHNQTFHSLKETAFFVSGIKKVHSYHHQCCLNLPSCLTCCAISDDHVIEAFMNDFIYGVQWHPELEENDIVLPFFMNKVLTYKINKNQNG